MDLARAAVDADATSKPGGARAVALGQDATAWFCEGQFSASTPACALASAERTVLGDCGCPKCLAEIQFSIGAALGMLIC